MEQNIKNFTFDVNEDGDRVYITDKETQLKIKLDFGTLSNERFVCVDVEDIKDTYDKDRTRNVFYSEISIRKD